MSSENPIVVMETSLGEITLEIFADDAPQSVQSFLGYVSGGFYENTIFHRVLPDFMVQGGGFDWKLKEKPTAKTVPNEAKNGRKNLRGTVALARTDEIDSASCQFFVNLADNEFLDHTGDSPEDFGYAVFGEVVDGMDVVDAIGAVPTRKVGAHEAVPAKPVLIKAAVQI